MSEPVNEMHGMDAAALAHRAKEASFALAALPGEVRSRALAAAAKALRANDQAVYAANALDVQLAANRCARSFPMGSCSRAWPVPSA